MRPDDYRALDLAIVAIGNTVNLLVVGVFLSRAMGARRLEAAVGLALVSLGIPLVVGIMLNMLGKRSIWMIVLPSIMVAYLLVELALDYVLMIDFRRTRLLAPYLVLFYAGLMAMIGYAFLVGRVHGFVTLASYFVSLMATWFSYSRVGHG